MQMYQPFDAIMRVLKHVRLGLLASGAVFLSLPTAGIAQDANDVTLRFASGQDSMIGELTKFEDNKYFVNSSIGLVVIPAQGVTCEGTACPEGTRPVTETVAVEPAPVEPAPAEPAPVIVADPVETVTPPEPVEIEDKQVVLKATNGSMTVTGDFIAIEDDNYVVATPFGELRIEANLVTCEGQACPDIPEPQTTDKSVSLSYAGITMTGTLLGFEDNTYILDDDVMGTIRVSAEQFVCEGPGCP